MSTFNLTDKKTVRPFDASEWEPSEPMFFKGFNFFEALEIDELFETYRSKTATVAEKFQASFDMLKMSLVDKNGAAILTDDDFETVKNAPFAPLIRAWSYALNPDFHKADEIQI